MRTCRGDELKRIAIRNGGDMLIARDFSDAYQCNPDPAPFGHKGRTSVREARGATELIAQG